MLKTADLFNKRGYAIQYWALERRYEDVLPIDWMDFWTDWNWRLPLSYYEMYRTWRNLGSLPGDIAQGHIEPPV